MGFDFLIDEDFRVWLIEVNTNPYFGVVNSAMPNFIDNLVDDTFKLTLDVSIKSSAERLRQENLYELLYSGRQSVNKRRPFSEALYPITQIREQLVSLITWLLKVKERDTILKERAVKQVKSAAPPKPAHGINGGFFKTAIKEEPK